MQPIDRSTVDAAEAAEDRWPTKEDAAEKKTIDSELQIDQPTAMLHAAGRYLQIDRHFPGLLETDRYLGPHGKKIARISAWRLVCVRVYLRCKRTGSYRRQVRRPQQQQGYRRKERQKPAKEK